MSRDDSEDILYELGCDCEIHFDQLHQVLITISTEAALLRLCADFQQRFAIWAAHLGLFARKSQCLDRRLRDLPEFQDLVARLLLVLRSSLQQCIAETSNRDGGHTDGAKSSDSDEVSPVQTEALKVVDSTLDRLTRIGVTIRQSSRPRVDERAQRLAADHDLKSFSSLCATAVQFLYPNAHHSLKSYLSQSMADRFARMLFIRSRQKKLETRRETRMKLPTVPELNAIPETSNSSVVLPARIRNLVPHSQMGASDAPSQSDLSSIDIQQLRARLKMLDRPSVKSQRTLSLQINQGNYPKPPDATEVSKTFTCEWCFEPVSKATLSQSDWRRHIDRDLLPYVCLAEVCSDAHPSYPALDEWIRHMDFHNRRWYQQVYLTTSWICTICDFNPNVYSSPQALYSHLDESHRDMFEPADLQAISRQSKTEQPRAWNDCLICGFTLEALDESDEAAPQKRRKEHSEQRSIKGARRNLEMMIPDLHAPVNEDSDTSSDSDDTGGRSQGTRQYDERSMAISRHIAGHLQVLMLLTLRFAALNDDNGGSGDDVNSESVDIGEGNSVTESKNLERVSEIASSVEVVERETYWEGNNTEVAKEVGNDETPVPNTNVDLSDIPRPYDDLSAENDVFLQQLISSGAYQSWVEEQETMVSDSVDQEDHVAPNSATIDENAVSAPFPRVFRRLERFPPNTEETQATSTGPGIVTRTFNWLMRPFYGRLDIEAEVTMVGLQGSGKASLLWALAGDGPDIDSRSTMGFNMKRIQRNHTTVKIWDVGGQPRFRNMWERYCRGVDAIIFVIDSTHPEIFPSAREELHHLMSFPSLENIPLLVLGSKGESPESVSTDDLENALDPRHFGERETSLHKVSIEDEASLDAVFKWIERVAARHTTR